MTSSASGHCGPITAECPASCLASVISLMALNRLLDSDDEPQTVGDVVGLYQEGKLTSDTFRYLGPRRRSEIEAVWCWPDSISRTGSATAKRGAPSDDQPGMAPRAARDEAGKHETAAEPVLAEVSMPASALPSRPAPTGVRAAAWVPPDPETLRRVQAALDLL